MIKKHSTSNQHSKTMNFENTRTNAFKVIANRQNISSRLMKTKPCYNMTQYGKCNRKQCNFAHSVDELKDPMCIFDKTCRKRQACRFKHSDESREEYHQRCGLNMSMLYKIDEDMKQPLSPKLFSIPKTPGAPIKRINNKRIISNLKPLDLTSALQKVSTEETTITGPIDVASIAFKAALKKGITRFNIILTNNK